MNLSAEGRLRLAARFAFVVGVGSLAPQAQAQQLAKVEGAVEVAQAGTPTAPEAAPAEEPGKAKQLGGVQVTGSRIRQPNLDSTVPVLSIDARQIELTGQTNAADVIRNLPVTGASAFTPANSNFSTQGAGLNTVDLRNLGEDRTLILVNGRRFVSGLPGSQTVDLNTIPLDFVERVDVITGGASAIYGSDALAGAVNFVLKKDFQGLVGTVQTGQTFEDHDDIQRSYRITGGSTFANGKGSAMFNATFTESLGVLARDRADTATDCLNDALDSGDAADFRTCTFFPSSYSANTNVRIPFPNAPRNGLPTPGTTRGRVIDPTSGQYRPFSTDDGDGFNRQGVRALSTPLDRSLFATTFNYEVNPSAKIFFEGTYSTTKARALIEPFPLDSRDIYGVFPNCFDTDSDGLIDSCDRNSGVPLDSLLVPNALAAGVLGENAGLDPTIGVVGFRRRLTEVGDRNVQVTRQTYRTVFGVGGDLRPAVSRSFFSALNYELSFNYGRTTDTQRADGQLNAPNLRNALDVVRDPTTNELICASGAARLEGCVPAQIFGQNTLSAEVLDYILAPSLRDAEIQQIVTTAAIDGAFWKIPTGGPIGFAAGVERRSEKSRDTPDALTQTGLNAGNRIPEVAGSFDVNEAFGELALPVLVNAPLAEELTLKGAFRASDYSTVGNTIAYSLGVDWQINPWVRSRMQFAKAVRAPNVGELFSTGSETFASVTDPCQGVTIDPGTGQPAFFNTISDFNNPDDIGAVLDSGIDATTINSVRAQNCLADPAVAERVALTGGLALNQNELQGTGGFAGASPQLGELRKETSYSRSYGLVLTPASGNRWLDNLSVSADFYSIQIKQAIAGIARQSSLDRCYSDTELSFGASNEFCGFVERFVDGPQIGALDEVNDRVLNIGSLRSSGVDAQLAYRFRIKDVVGANADLGRFNLTARYSHLLKYQREILGQRFNDRGKVGAAKDRAFASMTYLLGPFTANWNVNVIGASDIDVFAERDARIPVVAFHNMQLRYTYAKDWLDGDVFFGINNVTDKFVGVGGTNGDLSGNFVDQPVGSRTFPAAGYEPFGRAWYLGAQIRL